jgi:hypothetical protein
MIDLDYQACLKAGGTTVMLFSDFILSYYTASRQAGRIVQLHIRYQSQGG